MLHRPGGMPRALNRSTSHVGVPGARTSKELSSDAALAIRQRIRAPLRLAVPPRRTSQQPTSDCSDATARRRVAVKSSTLGSPQISPITAERAAHLMPSSIAQSASRASRASTWMRFCEGNPGGWMRPLSRIAIRSCTHSSGLSVSSCASRNPAHPPSRGCSANSSDRVGLDGTGKCHRPPSPLGSRSILAARLAPPATRERSAATRLTTLFYFCSLSRDSAVGVKPATRPVISGLAAVLRSRRGNPRSRARSG